MKSEVRCHFHPCEECDLAVECFDDNCKKQSDLCPPCFYKGFVEWIESNGEAEDEPDDPLATTMEEFFGVE